MSSSHTWRSPSYFRGNLDRPLTFWRAIWRCSHEAALKNHPYFYLLTPREQSNFLLRQLHHTCRVMGTPPMTALMAYVKRNSRREPYEFLLVQAMAAINIDELIADLRHEFPDDPYPVRRFDPDAKPDPAYTIRIPPLPAEALP